TPGLRLAGRRAILLPAALLAATLVALQAVPAAADEGWTIDAFDVEIIVHQDATMAVRETLHVDFGTQSHHGIFRDIPVIYEWDSGRAFRRPAVDQLFSRPVGIPRSLSQLIDAEPGDIRRHSHPPSGRAIDGRRGHEEGRRGPGRPTPEGQASDVP